MWLSGKALILCGRYGRSLRELDDRGVRILTTKNCSGSLMGKTLAFGRSWKVQILSHTWGLQDLLYLQVIVLVKRPLNFYDGAIVQRLGCLTVDQEMGVQFPLVPPFFSEKKEDFICSHRLFKVGKSGP